MEYDHYAHFYPRGGTDLGTYHLVREKDGKDVVTACGLELRETGRMSIADRQVFVHELTEDSSIGNNTCGNCPWDEVDV